jgi:hypothetical protein
MTGLIGAARLWRRPWVIAGACLGGIVMVVACLAAIGLRDAGAHDSYAAYPVLTRAGSSGLTAISGAREANAARGPVWDAADRAVDVASAREVNVGVAGLRVWVARGTGGSICVLGLVARPNRTGASGPASSCSPAGRLGSGATLEQWGPGAKTIFLSGTVPSGVSEIAIHLLDGSTRTVTVVDNAYAAELPTEVRMVTFESSGTQKQINLGDS